MALTWDSPDGNEDITGYRVYRSTVGDSADPVVSSLTGDARSFNDDTVAPETWYTYWVVAYNDVGDSPDSSRITLQSQVQTAGVPDAPTGLTVTEDTAGEVTISWRIPSGGPQATGHNIYRQHIGHTEFELLAAAPAGTTSVSDDTVEAEQWYGYYVKAVNAAGESTASGTDLINTKPQTVGVPEQPASLDAAEDVTGEVTLSWSAPGNGPAPTGYSVYGRK